MVHRVLVVDDHEDVRSAIVMMLGAEGVEIVGGTVVLISSHEARVHGPQIHRSTAFAFITEGDLSGATVRRSLGEVDP